MDWDHFHPDHFHHTYRSTSRCMAVHVLNIHNSLLYNLPLSCTCTKQGLSDPYRSSILCSTEFPRNLSPSSIQNLRGSGESGWTGDFVAIHGIDRTLDSRALIMQIGLVAEVRNQNFFGMTG